MDIGDILWLLGKLCAHLVHFSGFGIMYEEKSGNPAAKVSYDRMQKTFVAARAQHYCRMKHGGRGLEPRLGMEH
jgi:hypothetical protein